MRLQRERSAQIEAQELRRTGGTGTSGYRAKKEVDWLRVVDALMAGEGRNVPVDQADVLRRVFNTGVRGLDGRVRRHNFRAILAADRKLRDPTVFPILWNVASQRWIRPIGDWKPKGKGRTSRARSLAKHLLASYAVPPFLFSVLESTDARVPKLFAWIGQGNSLKRAGNLLPPVLTKRMQHAFLASPMNLDIYQAARRAQALVFGAEPALVRALVEGRYARDFCVPAEEAFRSQMIQWLCNQPMFDPVQAGPVIDFIEHTRAVYARDNRAFTLQGRTGASVMRGMEEWHAQLAAGRRARHGRRFDSVKRQESYKPCGLRSASYELGSRKNKVVWSFREILTYSALVEEGAAMRHCVASYAPGIEQGRIAIWQLRRDRGRELTIEVGQGVIRQVRGVCNRRATNAETRILQRWADLNSLAL